MSWTQPICQPCWDAQEPGREPVRLRVPEQETCCLCGADTTAGIYIRIDPAVLRTKEVS